jgi:hypothetical protein
MLIHRYSSKPFLTTFVVLLSAVLLAGLMPKSAQALTCDIDLVAPFKHSTLVAETIRASGAYLCDQEVDAIGVRVCIERHVFGPFWDGLECRDFGHPNKPGAAAEVETGCESTEDFRTHVMGVYSENGIQVNDEKFSNAVEITCDRASEFVSDKIPPGIIP